MEGSSAFEAKLNEEAMKEQAAQAAKRNQAAQRLAEKIALLRQEADEENELYDLLAYQVEFDKDRRGTPPEEIWGEAAGKLCEDFIDFMKNREFRGAELLTHTEERVFSEEKPHRRGLFGNRSRGKEVKDEPVWSIRGYGIGAISPPAASFDVFLCEDNKLRMYARRQFIHEVRRSALRLPVVTATRNADPNALSNLPLTWEYEFVVPKIGFIEEKYVGERTYRAEIDSQFAAEDSGIGGIVTDPAYTSILFREQPLEGVLIDYAKAAETSTAAPTPDEDEGVEWHL